MSTITAQLQRSSVLRPKYLLFAFVGLMLAYVLRHNESFLIHPADPVWQHYQPFKWWLLPQKDRAGYVWMGRGFGGQRLMVFPDRDLIVTFTGWSILKDPPSDQEFVGRILPAVRTAGCAAAP